MSYPLYAVQQIRRMRGGSQAHLMRASDGAFYVVKFTNSPQGTRILANEFLASRLGLWLGLPVPPVEVMDVSEWLIEHTPELRIEVGDQSVPCASGRQVASRYAGDPLEDQVFDYLPESAFKKVKTVADFVRILVLDKWAGNCDGRQAVFTRRPKGRSYSVTFIDQAFCFNAQEWSFPDHALHGTYYQNFVYTEVTGWEAFEPALTRAEEADIIDLWRCAERIPPEWYEHDSCALEKLVETLYDRRTKIRDLITAFRDSSRNPFPNWRVGTSACAATNPSCLLEQQLG
jgi:hypothetical protein